MKQPRNVLRMVVHAKLLLNPLADERPGPHARLKPRGLRARLDDASDLLALLDAQSRRAPGQRARPQPVSPLRVVPGGPLRDGGSIDADLLGHVDGATTLDVAQHALGAAPHRQLFQNRRFMQKLPQSPDLRRRQPRRHDCPPIRCASHEPHSQHARPQMERRMMTALSESV
jgi:hypothetical protein